MFDRSFDGLSKFDSILFTMIPHQVFQNDARTMHKQQLHKHSNILEGKVEWKLFAFLQKVPTRQNSWKNLTLRGSMIHDGKSSAI